MIYDAAAADAPAALVWVAKLASIPLIIGSLEYLHTARHLRSDGLMSWEVARLQRRCFCAERRAPLFDALFSFPNVLWLYRMRLVGSFLILVAPMALTLHPGLVLPVAGLQGLTSVRIAYGLDGSDQMSWVTFGALAIAAAVPTAMVQAAALWFLAFQICLSYLAAGFAKLASAGWRNGQHLTAIVNLRIYGHPRFGWLIRRAPWLAFLGGWTVLGWECIFAVVLLAPRSYTPGFLTSGVIFHGLAAYTMGLNCFFWSFVATYPAIFYAVQHRGWLGW